MVDANAVPEPGVAPESGVAEETRDGIGLCLSGGGFRATLFHLGAVRRLHELGILTRKDFRTISSVSGGSIASAHFAATYPWPAPGAEWERVVAKPLRAFTEKNIRIGPVLKSLLPGVTALDVILPYYDRFLNSRTLASITTDINFVFCATDMEFGANFEFRQNTMGDWLLGHIKTPSDWPLAKAVAASACTPAMFNPMKLSGLGPFRGGSADAESPEVWKAASSDVRLTDGGVYDNMGLEPVWKSHKYVLVSDAGGLFDFHSDENFFWRIERYQAIQETQALYLRKRWLIANDEAGLLEAAYWGSGCAPSRYDPKAPGYSKDLARNVIAEIRTDMDSFSDAESAVLQNHGYLLADIAVKRHTPALLPAVPPPLAPPFPDWFPPKVSEAQIREALKGSSSHKFFGRSSPR